MNFSFAALAALLSSALPQAVYAQTPPYLQIPVPWQPGVGPQHQEHWDYDRERREHCEHLRHQEHEIRERLAYAPPYGEERGRLEYRLREVHYERERCADR
ncbi:MAG: hypothetical protein JO282_00830 [Alphaproteobacteria bacterium]|nr:hypothetical protein [Alphaproteobacteria bacterium]